MSGGGAPDAPDYVRRHVRFGWWSLLAFLLLGVGLEGMHGFKVGWYLDVGNETRRLVFTLAHAHGTLVALMQLAFAFTVRALPGWTAGSRGWASTSLLCAGVLLPAGFFLGGIVIYEGDPGPGILLAMPGAGLLALSVLLTALGASAAAGPGGGR